MTRPTQDHDYHRIAAMPADAYRDALAIKDGFPDLLTSEWGKGQWEGWGRP